MQVLMPSRILDRHVGGNTTYARELERTLTALGHSVGRIPSGRHPILTMATESLAAAKKGEADQVLHYVADTGPLVRTKRPSVVTVHGVASRWIDNGRSRLEERVWRERVQAAISCTNRIVTVSKSSAADIYDIFDVRGKSVDVIPHGIDTTTFSKASYGEAIPPGIPSEYVLYVGNIEPRKNLSALVAAFQTPELIATGVPLIIAGRPAWNHEEILRDITVASNVIYLGFVSNAVRIALMQNCSLFVFPSLYEGFGFPVLEALASGAVVACSDRGSLHEVAGPAIRFESLTSEALADGVHAALTDEPLRQKCVREGLSWASGFSWDASATAHVATYEKAGATK
jgi:glycosyltransferase involved in cell wall biosynthesis